MALAGLKKQFNKANQYVSEKMGAAEGTKFTEEFLEMEKKTEATVELVDELINRTKEYLQPNPGTRAKLMLSSKVATSRAHTYSQSEGMLGDSMLKYGRKIGDETLFTKSLSEMGEALKQMAEVKYSLEDTVKQNFLEPLTHLQNKDIRDVMHHRKKLESRRLDFDCKRRRKKTSHVSDDDLKVAEDKFEESFNLASMGMFNLLQNETEQISQLFALSEALYEYHSQCSGILDSLTSRLLELKDSAAQKPTEEFIPRKLDNINILTNTGSDELATESSGHQYNGGENKSYSFKESKSFSQFPSDGRFIPKSSSPLPSPVRSPARTPAKRGPCCQALYDFDAENPKELCFKEGDVIQLTSQIDDNWLEGALNGKSGIFPVSYIQILVPLPQ